MREVRRALIDMALRRQRPGTGTALAVMRRRQARVRYWDASAALSGLAWCVCGAVAGRLYMPERTTADLDILVHARDLAACEGRLAASGWTLTGRLAIGCSHWEATDGAALDLLACADGWVDGALAQAPSHRDPQGLPTLPLPFLVLMKLDASRSQDVGDLARMLGQADAAALAAVRAEIQRWRPEDAEDLESLIHLGRLELGLDQA